MSSTQTRRTLSRRRARPRTAANGTDLRPRQPPHLHHLPRGSNHATYAYDNANRLSTVTDWNSTQAAYTYDDANRMTTATLPNGVVSTSSYDNANRLTGITHNKGATTLASVSDAVDAV